MCALIERLRETKSTIIGFKLINIFTDVEERRELVSHASTKLDTEAYAVVGPNRDVCEEE
jgi:hypothetical protein